jgi:hypothetical protein
MNVKIAIVATLVGIMALCLVATKPIGNQAFAYCDLTLKADPGSGSLAVGESMRQDLSGKLDCSGTGLICPLCGATISFTGLSDSPTVKTDIHGNYHMPITVILPWKQKAKVLKQIC